jgi:hypothetical protein
LRKKTITHVKSVVDAPNDQLEGGNTERKILNDEKLEGGEEEAKSPGVPRGQSLTPTLTNAPSNEGQPPLSLLTVPKPSPRMGPGAKFDLNNINK